jgi:hypothetical protein
MSARLGVVVAAREDVVGTAATRAAPEEEIKVLRFIDNDGPGYRKQGGAGNG